MKTTIEDSHIRTRALDPSTSFIVQAPAGSGKTELLTQRYLVLLSHAQKAPEEIIAITFTRKAAAEMRARIIHALTFAQTPEPDKNDYRHTTWQLAANVLKKNDALQWDLIQNPNRLRILTIDALSAFLCRQTPMLTSFGGSPAVCENAAGFYTLAAQRVLLDATPEHLLLHLDNNVSKVEKLLAELLNHRDQWLPHILYCYKNQHALRESLENSLKRIVQEKIQIAAQRLPEHLRQVLVLLARHAGNYFEENSPEHVLSACANFNAGLKPSLTEFQSWFGLANLLLTKEGEWRKTVTISNGFGPKDSNKSLMLAALTELQAHKAFKESLCEILLLPPTSYSELQWDTLTALTQLLPLLSAQLTLVFQEKGQIDFIELNLAALKALGSDESPTDLALYLDYQIQHLLIDEFQDTSVMHLHLIEKITAGWEDGDGRTLFVVGDPMQSIYRFRNAEVGLFLRAQEQGIGNIYLEPLTLTMNFRSQQNLVSWFNNTFGTIFPAVSDIATGRVPYTKAIAAKSEITNHDAHFYPVISDNDEDEAKLIAEKIKSITFQNPNDRIAILVRGRAQLIPIIHCLQQHALSYQAIDIEPLANRPEIQDLLSLTRAVLHRADHIAWLALLRSPFCGCTLADLEAISQSDEKRTLWETILACDNIINLSTDGLQRLQKIKHYLQHAFQTQYQLSLSTWIEGIWIALGGPACVDNKEALNHTRAYFNLLSNMESDTQTISIDALVEQCEKLFANAQNNIAASIHIMTIHKSKGLEFDHVFLPGLQRKTPSDDTKLFRWLNRPNAFGGDDLILAPMKSIMHQSDTIYDYLKFVENQKQDYEVTRLLYVAATRAKKSLHLFARLDWDEKEKIIKPAKKGSFLQELWPVYESIIKCNAPTTFAERQTPVESQQLFSRLSSDWELPFHTTEIEIAPPIKIDLSLRSETSRFVGTVIHEVLQYLSENKIPLQQSQWRSRLLTLGVLPNNIPECLNIITQAISTITSDERGKWILSNEHQDARSEWALTYSHESKTLLVIIDRSFVDKNNTRWIIDYKNAQPKETESLDEFLNAQKKEYQFQLEKYAGIIAQMENRPIQLGLYFPLCAGWIEWHYKV